MPRTHKKPVLRTDDVADYPSLNEHRASRRRFLQGGLVLAGAGALAMGCPGLFNQEISGSIEQPDYHRVRFPIHPEDRAVYLVDDGYARFYVVGLTYHEDAAMFAEDERDALTDAIAETIASSTYDALSTDVGHDAAVERIRTLLNDAYNENTGDVGTHWFEYVELTFTRLDAPAVMGGVAPDPSYP